MKKLLLTVFATILFVSNAAAENTYRLCGGSDGGAYDFAAKEIAKKANKINIEVVADTGGTMANIEATVEGECDAFIGQPDGMSKFKRTNKSDAYNIKRVAQLHKEYAHFLCNKESGIKKITQLEHNAEYTLDLVSDGSGGAVTWDNFVAEDDGYAAIKKVYSDDAYIAASNVASGDTTCMLLVSGIGAGTVGDIDADMGVDLILASATDYDFNDAKDIKGKQLYSFDDIEKTYTENLQKGWFTSVETVSMRSGVYYDKTKFKGKDLKHFIKAVNKAKGIVRDEYDR